jgi:hypothetical protein
MEEEMAPKSTRAAQACEAFKGWYSRSGHWVYDTRAQAAATWIERGIEGRASAPAEAPALLADWIAADPMPALIEKLRAEEAAEKAAA